MRAIFLFILIFSCYKVEPTWVKRSDFKIKIFHVGEYIPNNYNIIGEIFVGPTTSSFSYCGYDETINRVAEETKNLGGNAFKITELKPPDSHNICYRIYALALRSN